MLNLSVDLNHEFSLAFSATYCFWCIQRWLKFFSYLRQVQALKIELKSKFSGKAAMDFHSDQKRNFSQCFLSFRRVEKYLTYKVSGRALWWYVWQCNCRQSDDKKLRLFRSHKKDGVTESAFSYVQPQHHPPYFSLLPYYFSLLFPSPSFYLANDSCTPKHRVFKFPSKCFLNFF